MIFVIILLQYCLVESFHLLVIQITYAFIRLSKKLRIRLKL